MEKFEQTEDLHDVSKISFRLSGVGGIEPVFSEGPKRRQRKNRTQRTSSSSDSPSFKDGALERLDAHQIQLTGRSL